MTPTDLSPSTRSFDSKLNSPYELGHSLPYLQQSSLLFERSPGHDNFISHSPSYRPVQPAVLPNYAPSSNFPFFEPFTDTQASGPTYHNHINHSSAPHTLSCSLYNSNSPPAPLPPRRTDTTRAPPPMDWRLAHNVLQQPAPLQSVDWLLPEDKFEYNRGTEPPLRTSFVYQQPSPLSQGSSHGHEV